MVGLPPFYYLTPNILRATKHVGSPPKMARLIFLVASFSKERLLSPGSSGVTCRIFSRDCSVGSNWFWARWVVFGIRGASR